MDWMQLLSNVGMFFVTSGVLAWLIKQVFQINFDRDIEQYKNKLEVELEKYKFDLNKDLEKLKISETELNMHKAEIYKKFIDFLVLKILNKDYMARMNNPRVQQEMNDMFMTTGCSLFFYSNDATVKKFIEYRRWGLNEHTGEEDKQKILILFAELMLEMRKDLGYTDTECDIDDILYILLKDWSEEKSQQLKQALGLTA